MVDIGWYHGSDCKITKFDYNLVGSKKRKYGKSDLLGYGLYFVNDVKIAQMYGEYITEIKLKVNTVILSSTKLYESLKTRFESMKDISSFLNDRGIDGMMFHDILIMFNDDKIEIVN